MQSIIIAFRIFKIFNSGLFVRLVFLSSDYIWSKNDFFVSKIIKMMHSEFIFGFRMSKNPKIRYFIPKNGQNTLWKFSANQKLALGLGFVWPFPFDMVFLLVPKALACFLFFLLPIFLFIVEQYEEKMNEKMFLTVSRDSSTDKQQRLMWSLSDSTLSDKRVQNQNSNHNFSNETRRSNFDLMSISWPSDRVLWKPMHVIHAFLHRNARILIKTNFFRSGWEWDSEKVFWLPSLKGVLMTSRTWITIQLPKNIQFRWRSIGHKKFDCPCHL